MANDTYSIISEQKQKTIVAANRTNALKRKKMFQTADKVSKVIFHHHLNHLLADNGVLLMRLKG